MSPLIARAWEFSGKKAYNSDFAPQKRPIGGFGGAKLNKINDISIDSFGPTPNDNAGRRRKKRNGYGWF
jgi:hypothetical protein